jgi:hypothetical protein
MIRPEWTPVGVARLDRTTEGRIEYAGELDLYGFPYHVVAHVEATRHDERLVLRLYFAPPRAVPADASQPAQATSL